MVFAILFTLTTAAFSSECTNIRLDVPGESMENVQHRDQGTLGICYSYAGTALFDAYQAKKGQKVKNQSSAIEASAGVLQKRISNRIEISGSKTKESSDFSSGGTTCEIVNYLMKNGGCSEESVSIEKLSPDLRDLYMKSLKDLFYENNVRRSEIHENVQCNIPNLNANLEKQFFPFRKIKKNLDEKNFGDFFKKIVSNNCAKGKRGNPIENATCIEMPPPWKRKLDPEVYIPATREQLTSQRQPVSISFCSKILRTEPGYTGYDKNEIQFELRKSDCGLHDALIIGMRKVNVVGGGMGSGPRCQYLIRNSWEKEAKYSPWWESEKNGNVWVDEESLFRNVEGISFIKSN